MGRRMAKKKAPAKDKAKNQRKRATIRRNKLLITDPLVREHWDDSLTLKQNYAKIGLSSDGNEKVKLLELARQSKASSSTDNEVAATGVIDAEGNVTVAESPAVVADAPATSAPKEPTPLVKAIMKKVAEGEGPVKMLQSDGQKEILERLVAKHGNDFKAMARDIKLNTWQHTARTLEKRCKRYLKELSGLQSP